MKEKIKEIIDLTRNTIISDDPEEYKDALVMVNRLAKEALPHLFDGVKINCFQNGNGSSTTVVAIGSSLDHIKDKVCFDVILVEDKKSGGYTIWGGPIVADGDTVEDAKKNFKDTLMSALGRELRI